MLVRLLAAFALVLAACGDDSQSTSGSSNDDTGSGGNAGQGGATPSSSPSSPSSSADASTASGSDGSSVASTTSGSSGGGTGGADCVEEVCNGVDDDCSGRIDDGLVLGAPQIELEPASHARVTPLGEDYAFTYSTSLADLDVTLQRVDASGAAVGESTLLTTDGGDHVVVPHEGGFHLFWRSEATNGVSYADFDEAGAPLGEVQTAFDGPATAFDAIAVDGGIVVAVVVDDGIETQALSTVLVDTDIETAEVVEADVRGFFLGRVTTPHIVQDGPGLRLFWTETTSGGTNPVRIRRIEPSGVALGEVTEPLQCCDTDGLGAVVPFGDGFALAIYIDGLSVVIVTSRDDDEPDFLIEEDNLPIQDPSIPGLAVHDGRLLINTGWRLYLYDAAFDFVGAWNFAFWNGDMTDVRRSRVLPTETGWAVSTWSAIGNGGRTLVSLVGPNGCDRP